MGSCGLCGLSSLLFSRPNCLDLLSNSTRKMTDISERCHDEPFFDCVSPPANQWLLALAMHKHGLDFLISQVFRTRNMKMPSRPLLASEETVGIVARRIKSK